MTFYSNDKRKSYVLNPRGKPLYDDANRFGTKMLEKMGWSKGKGLGVNLDGEQNFIKVSHKVDQKGIGFEDRDDQWTQHENQFNSLLKSLDNSAAPSENEDNNEDDADELSAMSFRGFGFADAEEKPSKKKKKSITDTLSGKSLEEMSKNSKSRLHYKKFTRGKDLSKYSEKDLANIFGKKVTDDADEKSQLDEEADKQKDVDLPLSNYGITTIETGTTISDYFNKIKSKLLKRGAASDENSASSTSSPSPDEEVSQEPEKKRKKKKKDRDVDRSEPDRDELVEIVDDAVAEVGDVSSSNSSPIDSPQQESKKKRKNKKKDRDADRVEPAADEIVEIVDDIETKKEKKSRKKKEKLAAEEVIELDDDEADVPVEETSSKKKNKKKKEKRENGEPEVGARIDEDTTIIIDDSPVAKTKKKKSKKRGEVEEDAASVEVTPSPNPFISNILSTMNYANNVADSPTEQQTQQSVATAGTEASTSTAVSIHQFAHETFEINRYQAELFRFVDLDGFTGANLSDLTGYGFTKNIDLKITARTHDRNRINDLWDNALINKYGKDVIKAKKKQKYSMKTLKNKKLFKAI